MRTVRGAIILAGGPSRRLGRPKAFVEVGGVSLIARVVVAAKSVAEDVVVVSRGALAVGIERSFPDFRVVRDRSLVRSPLVGLLAGARAVRSDYVAALACDLPFVDPALLRRLFSAAKGRDAAIPRWRDGRTEPLVAVHARRPLLRAVRAALKAGERANQSMIARLSDVRFVDVESLRATDPELVSFVNVNTPGDLRRAQRLATRIDRRLHAP